MLNTEHFVLLAGDPRAWDEEMSCVLSAGTRPENAPVVSLAQLEESQYQRGRRSLRLEPVQGDEPEDRDGRRWVLRLTSSLDGRQVLSGPYTYKSAAVADGLK